MATYSNSTYDPKTAIYNIEVGLEKEVLSTDSGIRDISSGSDLVFLIERLENCLTRAYDLTIQKKRKINPIQIDLSINCMKCCQYSFWFTFQYYEDDKCIQNL